MQTSLNTRIEARMKYPTLYYDGVLPYLVLVLSRHQLYSTCRSGFQDIVKHQSQKDTTSKQNHPGMGHSEFRASVLLGGSPKPHFEPWNQYLNG